MNPNTHASPDLNLTPGRCRLWIWLSLGVMAAAFSPAFASGFPGFTPLPPNQSSFLAPARLAVDGQARLLVADSLGGKVVVLDSSGQEMLVKTGLGQPLGIAVAADGKIYLGDARTGAVNVFDPQWNLIGHLGQGAGEFQLPGYIVTLTENGVTTVFVSDGRAHQVKAYRDGVLTGQYGSRGMGLQHFDFPAGICVATNGQIYVVDQNNDRVQVLDRNGVFLRWFTLQPSPAQYSASGRAQGITADQRGWLYVADTFQGHVKVFDLSGKFLGYVGSYGEVVGQLRSPGGVAVDRTGRLWVANANNGRADGFVAVASPPLLLLNRTPAGGIVVTWNEPYYALQVAAELSGPWNTLSATSPFTVPAGSVTLGKKLYFRLVR